MEAKPEVQSQPPRVREQRPRERPGFPPRGPRPGEQPLLWSSAVRMWKVRENWTGKIFFNYNLFYMQILLVPSCLKAKVTWYIYSLGKTTNFEGEISWHTIETYILKIIREFWDTFSLVIVTGSKNSKPSCQ